MQKGEIMKKSVILLAAAGFLAVFLPGCSKNHNNLMINNGVLTVGININYPPMEYYAEDGITPIGFDVSLGKALAHEMGLDVKFEDTAWEFVFSSLNLKKFDCVISSVTITEERRKMQNFSGPYIKNALVLVTPKNSKYEISSPSQLEGLGVAYQEKTTADDYMKNLSMNGLKFTPYEYGKMTNCFDDLRLGRVDAVLTDLVVAHHYLAGYDKMAIVWQGEEEFFGICMKKGDDALTNAINKSLEKLFYDGKMADISKEIFNGTDLVTTAFK